MHRYVLLLRGINVGGSKCIKMADLKKTLSNIEFKKANNHHDDGDGETDHDDDLVELQNIKSYLASGNVTFDLSTKLQSDDERRLEKEITNTLMKEFTFDVPVLIRHSTEFNQIIANNSYYSVKEKKIDDLYICLLMENPQEKLIENMNESDSYAPDEFEIVDNCIYLKLKNGASKTKLTNTMIEKKLKVNATTRNWKTMLELKKLL